MYAQNVHWEPSGPYTGEISAEMLLELGVSGSLVGHSERRQLFGETDETVARRARAALAAGLGVIACVGETLEQRESGDTELVLKIQVEAIAFAAGAHERLVIAYEPVWAIGTGQDRDARPRRRRRTSSSRTLLDVPVLYGGSVKPENAAELLAQSAVDGALVGGASLDPGSFEAICRGSVELVTLVILDGWGCAPPGPGECGRARRHAGLRPALARVPARDAQGFRRGGRAPEGPDGQLRGRPSDDRLGPDPVPGPHAGRTRRSATVR